MTQPNETPYKSPRRKLVHFFEKSRDQWKTKCQRAKATVKRLQNRVRFLEQSKAEWKSRAQVLEAEVAQLRAQLERRQGEAAETAEKNFLPVPVRSTGPTPVRLGLDHLQDTIHHIDD